MSGTEIEVKPIFFSVSEKCCNKRAKTHVEGLLANIYSKLQDVSTSIQVTYDRDISSYVSKHVIRTGTSIEIVFTIQRSRNVVIRPYIIIYNIIYNI